MLVFWIMIALSALGAGLLAPRLVAGGWALLVGLGLFAGFFLGLLVLFFLVICFFSLFVDMSKPQEKYSRFYGFLTDQFIGVGVLLSRIHIHTKGLEMVPRDRVFLLVSNHTADLDPVVIKHQMPWARLGFVSKRENEKIPIFSRYMHRIQCLSINRENDREALKTILRTAEILREGEHSMGVFPEGYESQSGELLPFRNGAFKIAQRAKVPIVVAVLRGTKQMMKNIFRRRSDVELEILGVVPAEDWEGATTKDMGDRIHKMMEQALDRKGAV